MGVAQCVYSVEQRFGVKQCIY